MGFPLLAVAFCSMVSIGCAVDESGDAASLPQAIVGGTDTSGDPAVALILSNEEAYCSGTLIAPRVVLTAGHCISIRTPSLVKVGNETIAVRGSKAHPQFDLTLLAHDLAMIFLVEDAHAPPATLAEGPRVGERVREVGFGTASATEIESLPVKRTGFQRVDSINETKFRGRPDPASPCERDSGGAVFDENNGLVGVISSGDLTCSRWALGTRVDAHRDFIDPALPPRDSGAGCALARGPSSGPSTSVPWLCLGAAFLAKRFNNRRRHS